MPCRQVNAKPYHWPHDNSFSRKNTALVIVDMQNDFCSPGGYLATQGYDIGPVQTLIPQIRWLLDTCREARLPIYYTREGHRPDLSTLSPRELFRSYNNTSNLGIGSNGPLGRFLIRGEIGHDIVPELCPLASEPVIDKPGRGAFAHTEFELMLRIRGIKNLIICGVTTDVCVSSTMREANDRAFDCLLVEDATDAPDETLHKAIVQSVQAEGGIFGATAGLDEVVAYIEQTYLGT